MNASEMQSLIVKILLLVITPVATKYHIDGNYVPAICADVADLIIVLYGVASHWNMKKVPENSVAIEAIPGSTLANANPQIGSTMAVPLAKVVGTFLLGLALSSYLLPAPAYAQPAPANSCDPATLFKGVTPTNFLTRIKQCNADDLKAAIDDASKQVPPDNASLACLGPVQTIVNGQGTGGFFLSLQLYRDAKRAGLLPNCLAWINSTLAP